MASEPSLRPEASSKAASRRSDDTLRFMTPQFSNCGKSKGIRHRIHIPWKVTLRFMTPQLPTCGRLSGFWEQITQYFTDTQLLIVIRTESSLNDIQPCAKP